MDVIIPAYKPDRKFIGLIEKLETQSYPVNRIIVMNTEQKYWDALVYENETWKNYSNLEVYHISRREFDHGRTRREGVRKSDAPIFIMMTQDALPADDKLIEHLIAPLAQENIAAAYARQLPGEASGPIEKYTRAFNYPAASSIKYKEDKEKLGIKTYFCSNVCAAYRREIYEKQGGFVREAIFNEDMIYAAGCIESGYGIAYAADAEVIHSHEYSNRTQFHRNFDLGVSQADHPEVFEAVKSESEGMKLVGQTAKYLRENGYTRLIFPMYVTSFYKWLGYKLGKKYKKLSHKRIIKYTMNQAYWERHWSV